MSTGFQGKFHRQNILSRFAKDLVRRSRSRCELCGKQGVTLEVQEVPPLLDEPLIDRCLFVCEGCRRQVADPAKMIPSQCRHLGEALYSEIPAVQVISYRLLRRIAHTERWAQDQLEHAYLDPELETWAAAVE